MTNFIQVDFMCIHCYSVGADSCTSFAEQVHGNFSLPVAITEFADQVTAYLLCDWCSN